MPKPCPPLERDRDFTYEYSMSPRQDWDGAMLLLFLLLPFIFLLLYLWRNTKSQSDATIAEYNARIATLRDEVIALTNRQAQVQAATQPVVPATPVVQQQPAVAPASVPPTPAPASQHHHVHHHHGDGTVTTHAVDAAYVVTPRRAHVITPSKVRTHVDSDEESDESSPRIISSRSASRSRARSRSRSRTRVVMTSPSSHIESDLRDALAAENELRSALRSEQVTSANLQDALRAEQQSSQELSDALRHEQTTISTLQQQKLEQQRLVRELQAEVDRMTREKEEDERKRRSNGYKLHLSAQNLIPLLHSTSTTPSRLSLLRTPSPGMTLTSPRSSHDASLIAVYIRRTSHGIWEYMGRTERRSREIHPIYTQDVMLMGHIDAVKLAVYRVPHALRGHMNDDHEELTLTSQQLLGSVILTPSQLMTATSISPLTLGLEHTSPSQHTRLTHAGTSVSVYVDHIDGTHIRHTRVWEQERTEMQHALDEMTAECERWQSQVTQLQRERDLVEATHTRARETWEDERENMLRTIEEMDAIQHQYTSQIQALERERTEHARTLARLEQEMSSHGATQHALQQQHTEMDRIMADLAESERVRTEYGELIHTLREEMRQHEDEMNVLRTQHVHEMETLHGQLQEVLSVAEEQKRTMEEMMHVRGQPYHMTSSRIITPRLSTQTQTISPSSSTVETQTSTLITTATSSETQTEGSMSTSNNMTQTDDIYTSLRRGSLHAMETQTSRRGSLDTRRGSVHAMETQTSIPSSVMETQTETATGEGENMAQEMIEQLQRERSLLEANLAEAKKALDEWESAYHTAHADVSRLEMELDQAIKRQGELEANALLSLDREKEMITKIEETERARVRWEETSKRVDELEDEKIKQQEMIDKMLERDRALEHELEVASASREEALGRAETAEGQAEELMNEMDTLKHQFNEIQQQHAQKQARNGKDRMIQTDVVTDSLQAENEMLHDELLGQKALLEHVQASSQDQLQQSQSSHRHVMENWREDKARLEAYIETQATWIEIESKKYIQIQEQMERLKQEMNQGKREFDTNRAELLDFITTLKGRLDTLRADATRQQTLHQQEKEKWLARQQLMLNRERERTHEIEMKERYEIEKKYDKKIQELTKKYEDELKKQSTSHINGVDDDALQQQYQHQQEIMKQQYERDIKALEQKHQQKVKELEAEWQDELDKAEQTHLEQDIATQEAHAAKVAELERIWRDRVAAEQAKQSTSTSTSEHDTRIDTIKRVFDQERDAWKQEKATMEQQQKVKEQSLASLQSQLHEKDTAIATLQQQAQTTQQRIEELQSALEAALVEHMHTMDATRQLHEKLQLDMTQPIQPQIDHILHALKMWKEYEHKQHIHDMKSTLQSQVQQQDLIQSILSPTSHNGRLSPTIPPTPLAGDSGSDSDNDNSRTTSAITSPRHASREIELQHQVEMLHEMITNKEQALKELQSIHAETQAQLSSKSSNLDELIRDFTSQQQQLEETTRELESQRTIQKQLLARMKHDELEIDPGTSPRSGVDAAILHNLEQQHIQDQAMIEKYKTEMEEMKQKHTTQEQELEAMAVELEEVLTEKNQLEMAISALHHDKNELEIKLDEMIGHYQHMAERERRASQTTATSATSGPPFQNEADIADDSDKTIDEHLKLPNGSISPGNDPSPLSFAD